MEFLKHIVDLFLHLDVHLTDMANYLGVWTYVALFLVVFCETGLVVTPFLPGDSLLFAVGALGALPGVPYDMALMIPLLMVAALLGDVTNYSIGRAFGRRIERQDGSLLTRLINREHLKKTETFYAKHGGKTIIMARFIPIIRTFAPFVAGAGQMTFKRFISFSVVGAIFWVIPFTMAGFFFGNLPFIKQSFHYVILGIIIVSVLPAVIEILKARKGQQSSSSIV
jgi:membrane-associated protein